MRGKIYQDNQPDLGGVQFWKNPVDEIIYATSGEPRHSFNDVSAYPVYDLKAHLSNIKIAQETGDKGKPLDSFMDGEIRRLAEDYQDAVSQPGRQREAALRSNRNSAVDILNVWGEVQGLRDREFQGKNLARQYPVPNLLISIDRATKFGGMTRLDEGQLGQLKELSYTRANFTAQKWGLKFVIHEEARLKNVHNVLQDSIRVAATKVDQLHSFNVISAAASLTAQAVIAAWDTFDTNGVSDGSPLDDIGISQLNINGTAVGGKLTRIGMHQLTYAKYLGNTNLRGTASYTPREYSFEPGTFPLKGIEGIGLVLDQSIQQGQYIAVDTETENATIAHFQGPQRIGSAHDEETGDDKYFIIDYSLSTIVQSQTGRLGTGAITPLAW